MVLEIDVGDERRGASSGRLIRSDYKQGGILERPGFIRHQSKSADALFFFLSLKSSETCLTQYLAEAA